MTRLGLLLGIVAFGNSPPLAARQSPAFEVVSIKPNVSASFPVGPAARPGGVFVSNNVSLASIIRFAYNLPDYRLAGGPQWMRSEQFDVDARAARDASSEELRQMVQTLLRDRFRLIVRWERRDMPMYALLLERSDKRLGPGLRPASADCVLPGGRIRSALEERKTANGGVSSRRTCASMSALVSTLSNALQGPVDDRTALAGLWDYELSFTGQPWRNVDPAVAARDPNDAPALFTAVQEQLGLKLESSRGPVEVLVIDSAERPAPN
jgi:uncharacterized protein (TIGR03435 family)